MPRLVTISYTQLDAGGGVPKFNRDLHAAFPDRECVHFCWWDHPFHPELDSEGTLPEWYKARYLNEYLFSRKLLRPDDLIVADGFWADGLESFPYAISHSHGIWSHLTKEDVDVGKAPDMPFHHAAQVTFRRRWVEMGKPLTAVSDFIADQLRLQWGWEARVINNGVDTDLYRPMEKVSRQRPLVIHGVNDRANANKGAEFIVDIIEKIPDADVLSLDAAAAMFGLRSDRPWQKHEVLAQADLVVHPSGYEGNSMFVAEALACGVPVVGFKVGFAYKAAQVRGGTLAGYWLDLSDRHPYLFTEVVMASLGLGGYAKSKVDCGEWARRLAEDHLSKRRFTDEWRAFAAELEAK